jgi:hypothetical protein
MPLLDQEARLITGKTMVLSLLLHGAISRSNRKKGRYAVNLTD